MGERFYLRTTDDYYYVIDRLDGRSHGTFPRFPKGSALTPGQVDAKQRARAVIRLSETRQMFKR